jgi:cobalt-zinc-cadmium efflux system protein
VSRTQRLVVVLILNLALVVGLVAVGVTAHSLAVLAEGSDYLLDAAGVGVALLAISLSARPASRARPEGYPHATSVAALINGGWLLVLELLVAGAAIDRLVTGTPQVDGLPVLVVSAIAALVMTAGALVLRGDGEDGGTGSGTYPSRRSCSTRSPMPPRQPGWQRQAESSWRQEDGTGWTPPWRLPSQSSSPTTRSR